MIWWVVLGIGLYILVALIVGILVDHYENLATDGDTVSLIVCGLSWPIWVPIWTLYKVVAHPIANFVIHSLKNLDNRKELKEQAAEKAKQEVEEAERQATEELGL